MCRKIFVLEEPIVEVHADLDPWAAMSVGFDNKRELVFEMSYRRMGDNILPRLDYDKYIIVSVAETDKLIDKIHRRLTALPMFFADEFGYKGESWNISEAFETFDEILNYLSCLHIRYRIEKEFR